MSKLKITKDQYTKLIQENSKAYSAKKTLLTESFNETLYNALYEFLVNILHKNPTKEISSYFKEHNISKNDIISYLTGKDIIQGDGSGNFKVKNYFKRKFSLDEVEKQHEKSEELDKLTRMLCKMPDAPWNSIDEDLDYIPAGSRNPIDEPQKEPKLQTSKANKLFKPVAMGTEICLLSGPDGYYVAVLDDINRDELPNSEYELTQDDVADYVNNNIKTIKKGIGLRGFNNGALLIKLDPALKHELSQLYSKDKNFIGSLQNMSEMTGAGSSGAFSGPMAIKQDDKIEEITSAASSGQFVQPAIWAKDNKNWKGKQKPVYPDGKIVDKIDTPNIKKTSNSVISRKIYEKITKKTNKTIDEVKNIVEKNKIYETISKRTGRDIKEVKSLIESKVNK